MTLFAQERVCYVDDPSVVRRTHRGMLAAPPRAALLEQIFRDFRCKP